MNSHDQKTIDSMFVDLHNFALDLTNIAKILAAMSMAIKPLVTPVKPEVPQADLPWGA